MAQLVKILGIPKLMRKLDAKLKKHEAGLRSGLINAGFTLQRWSQQLVPIDTAALKNSARTKLTGDKMDVTVSYNTAYAIYVHEDLEARHAPGKQAKFLEQPLRERRDELLAIITKHIKKT